MSEVERFCRTCMSKFSSKHKENVEYFYIFKTASLVKKLMQCSGLRVYPSDPYPHSLCAECYQKIINFYEFRRMCRDSLSIFKEILTIGQEACNENDIGCQSHTQERLNGEKSEMNYDMKAKMNLETKCEYDLDDTLNDNQLIEFSMDTFKFAEEYDVESFSIFQIDKALTESGSAKRQEVKKFPRIKTPKTKTIGYTIKNSTVEPEVQHVATSLPHNAEKGINGFSNNDDKTCIESTEARNEAFEDNQFASALTTKKLNIVICENVNIGDKSSDINIFAKAGTTKSMKTDCTTKKVSHLNDRIHYSIETPTIEDAVLEQFSDYEEECVVKTLSEDEEIVSDPCYISPTKPQLTLPFHCDLCPKLFKFKHRLIEHKQIHSELTGYCCNRENCQRSFSRLCDLKQHLNKHDGIRHEIYKCSLNNCGKEYFTKHAINLHLRKQHNFGPPLSDNTYVCETCGTILGSARSLQEHLYIHMDKSLWPLGCDVEGCLSRFRNITQLKEHKNRHAGIKRYVCPHCNKRFGSSSNLSTHINYHTLEKKWSCQFCPKVCYTPANLRLHIQNRHEHKPKPTRRILPCRFCSKKLSSSAARKYHEMIHTGEKPFVCDECGRGFTQPTSLKNHKRIHTSEGTPKEFTCRLCDRAFTSSSSQKNHELKHTGEKPHECDQCGVKFRYRSNLVRHKRQNLCRKVKIALEKQE